MQKETENWFSCWFNTKYYHILYKNRDQKEAQWFMNNITQYLKLPKDGRILDLACGKARHSIYLNTLGYRVTGVDISENSISHAQEFASDTLDFAVHDMREVYPKRFDAVFNLFTSFGYFQDLQDNQKTIQAIKASLNQNGVGVIDFLNIHKVLAHLVTTEQKTVEGITFNIKRYVEDGFLCKNIVFTDQGETFDFTERVAALTLEDFKGYIEKAGMQLLTVFGSYALEAYDANCSDRLILIFK